MTVQEASVRIGADASAAMRTLKGLSSKMAPAGEEMGKELKRGFNKSVNRMFDVLSLTAVVAHISRLGSELKSLEGDAEALEKRFAHLGEAQRTALIQTSETLQESKNWIEVATGSLIYFLTLLPKFWGAFSVSLNPFKAINEVIRQEFDAMEKRANEIRAKASEARKEKAIKLEAEFIKAKEDFEFKSLTVAEKIAKLRQDELRLMQIADQLRKQGDPEHFKVAAQVLKIWERIKELQKGTPAPGNAPGAPASPVPGTPVAPMTPEQARNNALNQANAARDQFVKNAQGARDALLRRAGLGGGDAGLPNDPATEIQDLRKLIEALTQDKSLRVIVQGLLKE